ncbi:hypothetical protein [Streptomyces sp. YGL11-2]|uniref:hypothetical protein n=1 Tax=Streptomyces sp. YGL11-2 TaxID=3414028 RepID=UPI003CEEDDB7
MGITRNVIAAPHTAPQRHRLVMDFAGTDHHNARFVAYAMRVMDPNDPSHQGESNRCSARSA